MNQTDFGDILIVDDTVQNLHVLAGILKGAGHRVRPATSGPLALAAAQSFSPDMVLLDVKMPGMDGHEVCRKMHEMPVLKDVPVLFISAHTDSAEKVRAFESGGVDYITKPFSPEEVLARIQTHLMISRMQRELDMRYQQLEKVHERVKRDLLRAARIQRSLLPPPYIDSGGVRIACHSLACDEIGGDGMQYSIHNDTLKFHVLDVSGHGASAALTSVGMTHALTQQYDTAVPRSLATTAQEINNAFPYDQETLQYATLLIGQLDLENGQCEMICAGHPSPVIARADGSIDTPEWSGIPIGLSNDMYISEKIELDYGERMVLFSDGVTECLDPDNRYFDRQHLADSISRTLGDDLPTALRKVVHDLIAWRGNMDFDDDVSIMMIERS